MENSGNNLSAVDKVINYVKTKPIRSVLIFVFIVLPVLSAIFGTQSKKEKVTDANLSASNSQVNKETNEAFKYRWKHEEIKDPMTDKLTILSTLSDEGKSSTLGFMCEPNAEPNPQSLFVWTVAPPSNKKYEFGLHKWEFKVDIRFDDGPITTETWTLDLRYGSVPVSKNFIDNMMGKRKAVLRANILNQQTTYVYNISGFEEHYQKYIASCPSSNQ